MSNFLNQTPAPVRQGNHTAQREELTAHIARRRRQRQLLMTVSLVLVAAAITVQAVMGL